MRFSGTHFLLLPDNDTTIYCVLKKKIFILIYIYYLAIIYYNTVAKQIYRVTGETTKNNNWPTVIGKVTLTCMHQR